MLRAATVLIAILLTGGPTATLLCELFCASSGHSTEGCHPPGNDDHSNGAQVASVNSCHDQEVAPAFLAEAKKTEVGAAFAAATTFEVVAVHVDVASRPIAWWSVSRTGPPAAPPLHSILRV